MSRIISSSAFLLIAALLGGCAAKKPSAVVQQGPIDPFPGGRPVPAAPRDLAAAPAYNGPVDSLKRAQLQFTTLNFRAKGTITVDNKANDATLVVRIAKDKIIWASVSATIAQIEIARVLITPDSVRIINRAMEEYVAQPFSYLQRYTGKDLSFGTLQALLTASALPGSADAATVERKNGTTVFSGKLGALLFQHTTGAGYRIDRTALKNAQTAQLLNATYTFSGDTGLQGLPAAAVLQSSAPGGSVAAELTYSRVELNRPLETPFSIPRKYKKAD